jgi:stage II sporulation protein D
MMTRRNVFTGLVLLWIFSMGASAQAIRIGLYNHEPIRTVTIYFSSGEYLVSSGEQKIGTFESGDILFAAMNEQGISLHSPDGHLGTFDLLAFRSLVLNAAFRIRPLLPALESRTYDDDLMLVSHGDFMNLINQVDFDKYIAGVLEAEVGPGAEEEFYKAHALLTRTYMLNHFDKHREEGFSLCDGVDCQAYHGRALYNPAIARAVFETTGEVVADYHYRLITAVYHSNSGGETQRAADVWLEDTDYLQAVIDPYSLHQKHAKWYDTIAYDDWKAYLLDHGMESVKKIPDELLYIQQRHRKKYFVLDQDSLLMTTIREDWGFKSTFFNMFPEAGNRIVIWGKGYGHGVGLSQEGAMYMAKQGFSYKDILKFYFFNIRIMDYEDLPKSSVPDLEYDLPGSG